MSLKKVNKPLISVITIVYNEVTVIESTLFSVLEQGVDNIEYIVIDGGSNDGTLDIINKYRNKITHVVSEKDNGIYDAMNKGIALASGKWLNFMNAGDSFYNNTILSSFFDSSQQFEDKILVYGYKYTNGEKVYPNNVSSLERGGIMANHQSMFFNKELLKNELIYDLRYPIYGDYELVNRLYLKYGSTKFLFVDKPVANYLGGGISSNVSYQKRKDKFLIILRHYGLFCFLKCFIISIIDLFYRKLKSNNIQV